jgi:hypothetical protein
MTYGLRGLIKPVPPLPARFATVPRGPDALFYAKGQAPEERGLDIVLSVVTSVAWREEIEAMLAAPGPQASYA